MRLVEILASTALASGAQLRSDSRVSEILVAEGRLQGVRLASGEGINASRIVSGLGRRRTLGELLPQEALPLSVAATLAGVPRTASARLLLALNGTPPFAGLSLHDLRGRLLIAPRSESAAEAKGASLIGELPRELVLEMTVPTFTDASLDGPGHHALCVRIPYVPFAPAGGWAMHRDELKKRVLATIESYAPGLSDRVVAATLLTPEDVRTLFGAEDGGPTLGRLLASYATRIRTPVPGLYLCGSDAEPFDVMSGRAGRLAAAMARAEAVP
jgi:phytoene dehydrogenase-like protein